MNGNSIRTSNAFSQAIHKVELYCVALCENASQFSAVQLKVREIAFATASPLLPLLTVSEFLSETGFLWPARGVRYLPPHRHPGARHPAEPRDKDQKGEILGQTGAGRLRHHDEGGCVDEEGERERVKGREDERYAEVSVERTERLDEESCPKKMKV